MATRRAARAELEGLLAGLEQRVLTIERSSDGPSAARRRLDSAREELARGRLDRAESILVEVDRRLDDDEPEGELREFPRGLVHYVPRGERGAPVSDEEEPVANRIRLIGRLLTVFESQGGEPGTMRARLAEARTRLTAKDAPAARALVDAVHADLEAALALRATPPDLASPSAPPRRANEPRPRRPRR